MFHSQQRSGFTLVELLVVIAIIALLAALAVPGVMMAQERARRLQCANNLRNLGGAIQNYEISKKQYPGWINEVGGNPVGWPVMILEQIGRRDLWDEWRRDNPTAVQVSTFICPSSGKTGNSLSYVANCGQQDATGTTSPTPPDWAANGIFFQHDNGVVEVKLASDDIKDGLQYTLLLSENLQAGSWDSCQTEEYLGGMVWWLNGSSGVYATISQTLKINRGLDGTADVATGYDDARPSSYHPGGVNVVYCDGHCDFLPDQVEYRVYAKLMASNDNETKFAGSNNLLRDSTDTYIQKLFNFKLTEELLQGGKIP